MDRVHLSFDDLLCRLAGGLTIEARFGVHSDIGPGWIGGGRYFMFTLECAGRRLLLDDESPAHRVLREALTMCFRLPLSTEPDNLSFDGEITRDGDRLVLGYEWTMGAPYSERPRVDSDEATFYDVAAGRPIVADVHRAWVDC